MSNFKKQKSAGGNRWSPEQSPERSNDRPHKKSRPDGKPSGGFSKGKPWLKKSAAEDGPFYIYGLHTIEAAFRNPERTRHKLLITQNALRRLEERNLKIDVPVEEASPRDIDKLVGKDAVHQGAALLVDTLPEYGPEELQDGQLVLALDQVTDPHNVGAILRSAVALSADAVVTTRRHAPEEGPVLAKTASGALDMIKHVRVPNMSRFVDEMRDKGYQAIALDSEGPNSVENTTFTDKTLLVLGSEGKGVREGVRKNCDALARLDMPGEIKSLNVSNAAILSLYVARMKMGLS
ncbi:MULTISPECIES: RNA methyltransferase [unclassified Pseudovibrio]|uniref:TrmH family RNA methyltransferase n=1 Tax=unclassified Pseudovibrio TaxID=2627060 RepID=UPI0007AEAB93|nr:MULTISPECIES: RNA methyltransferase [unclassified Pseudovibrio]KZK93354.1 23S rRNA (guanosine-2'-O-)-methyltransferase RlmB [Pseudovibrio sp. Ad5]KZK94505.1 23S rRNA (guanosine-2'-O-)-methyltransferase RlmB [Pseudovibrio sp. W74]KZL06905.1 23S rRNA (guanosine-2'-O-)-methyltransferase RlmB [Pseudovibrio sp. Ad14]